MNTIENRTFIISGASSGLGRALAVQLAGAGASVVLNARREDALAEVLHQCARASADAGSTREHALVAGSAGSTRVARTLAGRALDLGDFAGFIHAAGVLAPGPTLWELPARDFAAVFESGPVAAHRLIRACVPPLVEQGRGLAVFVGSGAADIAQPGIAAYCAAKAALEHTMRQLAAEAPAVTSFVYRPGIVDTAMQDQARNAKGGGANILRPLFQSWKDEDKLLSAEESAAALMAILADDPRRFHGRVASVEQGRAILAETTGPHA